MPGSLDDNEDNDGLSRRCLPRRCNASKPRQPLNSSHRTHKRQRMVEMAKLITEGGTVYSCIIRDLSLGGAMLRVPAGSEIHGRVLIDTEIFGRRVPARVKWRDETSIGVEFD